MPKRVLMILAVLLLVEVFLVLIAPQVDLQDGVPRSFGMHVSVQVFLGVVMIELSSRPANRLRHLLCEAFASAPSGARRLPAASVLRC
jgi:hypothetical protein